MLLKSSLLVAAHASHYRSGSFQFSQTENNELILSRTLNYRRGRSGYSPACWQTDVENEKLSDKMEDEYAKLLSNGQIVHTLDTTYVVTDIEKTGPVNSQWCYGTVDDTIPKPVEPFEYYFENCCWVDLTDDDGAVLANGSYKLYAKYFDLDNNSPQVKVPPIWNIMTGCPDQTLALTPADKDGDLVKCRWSTEDEAASAHHGSGNYASLTLDEDTCVITYDGSLDTITSGVKPLAIQVEDYDANGNVRSSIPVQFLATVWEPVWTGEMIEVTRSAARPRFGVPEENDGSPTQDIAYLWGDVFVGHDHHEDSHHRQRREILINNDTGLPYFCDEPPQLIAPSPEAGSEIEVSGNVRITVAAYYYEDLEAKYDLDRFQFNSPTGMTCGSINKQTGQAVCKWTPTLEQREMMLHSFCFMAYDKHGRSTERRCITLKIVDTVNDIAQMLNTFAPQFGYRELYNYGCAGRGLLNPFHASIGTLVNNEDRAIHRWKNCIRCAKDVPLTKIDESVNSHELPKYDFNTESEICENEVGTVERAVCECDKWLTFRLQPRAIDRTFQRYQNTNCYRREDPYIPIEPSCCGDAQGLFTFYKAELNCCEADGQVLDIGTCVNDTGIAYEEKVSVYRPVYVHKDAADGTDNDGTSSGGSSGGDGTGTGGGGNIWDDGTAEG